MLKNIFNQFKKVGPDGFLDHFSKKIADKTGRLPKKAVPDFLNIEPSGFCNLRCRLCPTGNNTLGRDKGFMSLETFKNILDDWDGKKTRIDFSGFGEPFLNRDFLEMVRMSKEKGFEVSVLTNGNLLTAEVSQELIAHKTDKVTVAVDGATQDTYNWYRRGGDFNKVISNLNTLVETKHKQKTNLPYIELQFVVMKKNESEIGLIKKMAKELGVDKLILKTCGFYRLIGMSFEEFRKDYLPDNKKYQRLEDENNPISNFICPWMNHGAMILWDGRICACCYDSQGEVILGRVTRVNNFIQQWRDSPEYEIFRKDGIRKKYPYKVCELCPARFRKTKGESIVLN